MESPIILANQLVAYHVLPDSVQMQRDFLQVIASLAACSHENYADDIQRVARLNGMTILEVKGFQEYAGRGLGGLLELAGEHHPRAVIQGNRSFIQECGLNIPDILEVTARKWEQEPGSMIMLAGWDGWVRGILKFRSPAVENQKS